ncbi:nitroreductase/quinone reductase family protein [Caenibius sp. WL]|uniref:nitroreductase/quinone reductase family protein n=1 Tax=Caenibius sp. WL TaxID=2872646 RepID=UPI001C991524|nr:nitroreductase/quinone reductase family protein [Caenibius sp. WL]QZP08181.1 nitroreductase/quinone reductase family protein [Caenibius sp. WL]
MLEKFVMTPRGLALDKFLVRHLGYSLTTQVFARSQGYAPPSVLYLETVGRKSGQKRGVAVPYFELDGKILVVGSKGGAPEDPYWALNLRNQPEAVAYINRKRRNVRAVFLTGEERTRAWEWLKGRISSYRQYETRTTREIPVISLEPV